VGVHWSQRLHAALLLRADFHVDPTNRRGEPVVVTARLLLGELVEVVDAHTGAHTPAEPLGAVTRLAERRRPSRSDHPVGLRIGLSSRCGRGAEERKQEQHRPPDARSAGGDRPGRAPGSARARRRAPRGA
jgi:hypothetical protein